MLYRDGVFKDRTVLVTGAGQGIGRTVATDIAKLGGAMIVNDIEESKAEATADIIKQQGGSAVSVAADVGDPVEVRSMMQAAEETFGRVDHLVNNAGLNNRNELIDLSVEDWQRVLNTNLTGTFLTSRAVAKQLLNAEASGSIVHVASIAGRRPQPGSGAYSATKRAIETLGKQMALEWAGAHIRVNTVIPGLIWTPATDDIYSHPQLRAARAEHVPLNRIGEMSHVSSAILYLLAPDTEYVTGASLVVDGGFLCTGTSSLRGVADHR